MKNLICVLLCVFCSTVVFSQENQTKQQPLLKQNIVSILNTKVSADDFVWFYNKYNSYLDSSLVLSTAEAFDLFLEYKMKVLEAESQKLDTSRKFKQEFETYLRASAKPFLYNSELDKELIKLEFDRLQTDYKISQVFIRSNKKGSPKDTLLAYQKALQAKKEILQGVNFKDVVTKYSEDNFAKNAGDIGYITSLLLPLPYENAIYSSQVGDVIGPISTEYGYFVAKVQDKRKSKGLSKVSLIVVYPEQKDSTMAWENAKRKIDTVLIRLDAGESFESLSSLYNKNPRLIEAGGNIGWIDNSVRYDSQMKEDIFALETIGAYSKPLKYDYGFVLFKLTGKDSVFNFDQFAPIIERTIKTDESRKNIVKDNFIALQKKQNKFVENHTNVSEFVSIVDKSILLNKWVNPTFISNKVLFTYGDSTYRYTDFASFLEDNQSAKNVSDKEVLVRTKLHNYQERIIEQYAFAQLPLKNKEFALLMQEYHDGMIIYELLQKEVFEKASADTVALQTYYNEHKSQYIIDTTLEVVSINCKNTKALNKVLRTVNNPLNHPINFSVLSNKLNKKENQVSIDTSYFTKGENAAIDSLPWKLGDVHILEKNKVIIFNNVISNKVMSFEECKAQLISEYQTELEKKWRKTLREKYTVIVDEKVYNATQEYLQK